MTNLKNILKEFDKKFARKNIMTGQYEDKWFVKEIVTSGMVKTFLTSAIAEALKECEPNKRKVEICKRKQKDDWACTLERGRNEGVHFAISDYKEKVKKFLES